MYLCAQTVTEKACSLFYHIVCSLVRFPAAGPLLMAGTLSFMSLSPRTFLVMGSVRLSG